MRSGLATHGLRGRAERRHGACPLAELSQHVGLASLQLGDHGQLRHDGRRAGAPFRHWGAGRGSADDIHGVVRLRVRRLRRRWGRLLELFQRGARPRQLLLTLLVLALALVELFLGLNDGRL